MLFLKTQLAVVPQLVVGMVPAFQESILSLVLEMLLMEMLVALLSECPMGHGNTVIRFRYTNTWF